MICDGRVEEERRKVKCRQGLKDKNAVSLSEILDTNRVLLSSY
jgi:hypothetical protein